MSHEVYANGWEIAGKSGMNKSIARFPDVCLSPPSPPAGPIPVPYPNTSFSSDLKKGSKSVKLDGKPAALAQQSYYKPSVLGDEAATQSFGANVVTHQITGKTYFQAWSMDVKIEGKNVCRHFDITTSNHASSGTTTVPGVALEKALLDKIKEGICPCCDKDLHAGQIGGEPVPEEVWYNLDEEIPPDPPEPPEELIDATGRGWPNPSHKTWQDDCKELKKQKQALNNRRRWVAEQKKCPTAPKSPCNVYVKITSEQQDLIEEEWKDNKQEIKEDILIPLVKSTKKDKHGKKIPQRGQADHRVPQAAGGCPTGQGNLQSHVAMSKHCQEVDDKLGKVQSQCAQKWDAEIKAGA